MSRTLGWLAFAGGIVGTGWYGTANNAVTVEEYIATQANAVAQTAIHDVQATVSGRDIVLSGIANSQAEIDALVAAANEVDGRRVVEPDFTIIPAVEVYRLDATRAADGTITAGGNTPTTSMAAELADTTGVAALTDLTLASGAPDTWPDTVTGGLAALDQLDTGTLQIEGDRFTLTGMAGDRATADAVRAAVADLPGIADVTTDITAPLAVASPYTFAARKTDAGIGNLSGFAPSQEMRTTFADTLDGALNTELDLAQGAPDGWQTAVSESYDALSKFDTGRLDIVDDVITISGTVADGATKQAVEAQLAAIPGFTVASSVTAPDPVVAAAPAEPEVVPADMSVRFFRMRGLFVDGVAPTDVTGATVARDLGAPSVNGAFDQTVATTSVAPVETAIAATNPYLSEFETMRMTVQGEDVAISGETLIEADLEQIQDRLIESGAFTSVNFARAQLRFSAGDTRRNALTGSDERFTGRYWLPVVAVADPTVSSCTAATQNALEGGQIQFLTASSDLDATSRATLNAIAALIGACFDENADLQIEIGGHTDSVGSADNNIALSESRAVEVRNALIARGIDGTRVTAVGYGETQPIADNTTEEGLSANRRTTFVWAE